MGFPLAGKGTGGSGGPSGWGAGKAPGRTGDREIQETRRQKNSVGGGMVKERKKKKEIRKKRERKKESAHKTLIGD